MTGINEKVDSNLRYETKIVKLVGMLGANIGKLDFNTDAEDRVVDAICKALGDLHGEELSHIFERRYRNQIRDTINGNKSWQFKRDR